MVIELEEKIATHGCRNHIWNNTERVHWIDILQDFLQVVRVDFRRDTEKVVIKGEHYPESAQNNYWIEPELDGEHVAQEAKDKAREVRDNAVICSDTVS